MQCTRFRANCAKAPAIKLGMHVREGAANEACGQSLFDHGCRLGNRRGDRGTFAREGAAVMVIDINDEGGHRMVAEIRERAGPRSCHMPMSAIPRKSSAMIQATVDRFGRLDILHNNAVLPPSAESPTLPWRMAKDPRCRPDLRIGMRPSARSSRHAAATQGAIVNTASVSGLAGDYTLGAYNAVKAGSSTLRA